MAKTKAQIRHEIEETRLRMGDTIEALAYKTDVRARMREQIQGGVDSAKASAAGARTRLENGSLTVSQRLGAYWRANPGGTAAVLAGMVLALAAVVLFLRRL